MSSTWCIVYENTPCILSYEKDNLNTIIMKISGHVEIILNPVLIHIVCHGIVIENSDSKSKYQFTFHKVKDQKEFIQLCKQDISFIKIYSSPQDWKIIQDNNQVLPLHDDNPPQFSDSVVQAMLQETAQRFYEDNNTYAQVLQIQQLFVDKVMQGI